MAGPLALLPLLGKGLMWGGTAVGTAAGAHSLFQIPQGHREDLIRSGPNQISGKYDVNPFLSPFIDQGSLDDSRNKYLMDIAKKDPRVQAAQSLNPSLQLLNGMTADDFVGKYRSQIRSAQQEEQLTGLAKVQNAQFNSPQAVRERLRQDTHRADQLQLQRDQMSENSANRQTTLQLGQINARTAAGNQSLQRQISSMQNATTLQLAQMDSELADKRMAFDRETHRMDRRDRNIAQLMKGIGQLGGAFAL